MPLDPQVQAIRDRLERDNVPNLCTMSVADAREADVAAARAAAGRAEPVSEVSDRTIPGPACALPIRVYRPMGAGPAAEQPTERPSGRPSGPPPEPLPALVYFFGGGWSLGTIDTCDGVCRCLANATGCVTVAASYRLAPEHKFPAAVQDCHAVTAWVAAHAAEIGVDRTRIAVGGDSSGGNLAAAVTLLARDRGGPPIVHQLLVYPNTDYDAGTASLRAGNDPYLFNATAVAWYWGMYLSSPADAADPLASPLRAEDLTGLPPATVITAEYDPLRDEGEQYATRLRDAGVPVELTRYDGMMHGFFTMTGVLDGAKVAVAHAAGRLREAFVPTGPGLAGR